MNVITALGQELGTEADLVPTLLLHALDSKLLIISFSKLFKFSKDARNFSLILCQFRYNANMLLELQNLISFKLFYFL